MKNLNIVVGQTASGELKLLYLGTLRTEAREAMEAAVAEGELDKVLHARNLHGRTKHPAQMARRSKEFRLESEALAIGPAIAEGEEFVTLHRGELGAAKETVAELPKDATPEAVEAAKATLATAEETYKAVKADLARLKKRRAELVKIGLVQPEPAG